MMDIAEILEAARERAIIVRNRIRELQRHEIDRIVGTTIAVALTSVSVFYLIYSADHLTNSCNQSRAGEELWKREAAIWRAIAQQYTQPGVCSTGTYKCDAEKCWHVCSGTPAMEPHR